MDFWTDLEELRARWNVLEHPFYQRWSKGELKQSELALYAGEYYHAVVALAQASAHAAELAEPGLRDWLAGHAIEEAEHVALWDDFTRAVGGTPAVQPLPQTVACARTWADNDRSLSEQLVSLYAIESGQPAIAQTKRTGLVRFYGLAPGPATAYFDLHIELDREHAARERELIESQLEEADGGELLAHAESVLRANWQLLDGVEGLA